jgi:alpha-glucosidase (family GH31 glycosyl hydrolase)
MPLPPVPSFDPHPDPNAVVTAKNVRFTVLTDRLIRLEWSPEDAFEDRPSQAFWYRNQPVPEFSQRVDADHIEIETSALHLRYTINPSGFTPSSLSIRLKENNVTWHCGDPSRRAGNLKGTTRTLDMARGATHLEDGLLSQSGWAVVDDSGSLVFNGPGWLEARSHTQPDLYFFGYGKDHAACLRDFTRLAGPIPMIPRFILGNWWSRYWPYKQAELQALMLDFRAHDVPLSVCIVDMDWHITKTGNASLGWTGYTWNRELFPDPPGFIRWLHDQGLKTALNLHPAKGIYPHEEQYPEMARWMGIDPATQQPIPFDIADPRFAEGYFEILHHPQEAMGIDFWWMDWQQGKQSKLSGLDPLWWLNHLHYQDLGRDGHKRPFVFSRWGGLGNHRYPIGFSGDTFVRWSALAFQPYFTSTAANVAYGWWSHDIGGHMFKDKTPELYLRWVQFGVFSPILRLHSTRTPWLDRRPWGKPERIFHAARQAMQLRHALIPYIYSMAWRAHQTGISLVTPMVYGNMDSPAAYKAKDQYFFGSELLAAPILKPARRGKAVRRVWFPPGTWTNFFTGQQMDGGGWKQVKAALEDIPVFAKAGAIVPLAPKVGWGGTGVPEELDIYIFPGADNRFELYEDDGESIDYLSGKYALTRFTLQNDIFSIHPLEGDVNLIPAERTYRLHLRGVEEESVKHLQGSYDPSTRTFSLAPVTHAAKMAYNLSIGPKE